MPFDAIARDYDEAGYVVLDNWFDAEEVDAMRGEFPRLLSEPSEGRTIEKDSEAVRILYGVHHQSDVFRALARHPRMLSIAERLLGSAVYVHQSKLNMKAAFEGSAFEWHQDFAYWSRRDGIPAPRVVNMVVFLDEVSIFNGPMFVIPGSHRLGLLTASEGVVARSEVAEAVARGGLKAALGGRGTLLIFGGLLVHASPANISPHPRAMVLVTFNAIDNASTTPGASPRHLCETQAVALKGSGDEDALRRRAPAVHASG